MFVILNEVKNLVFAGQRFVTKFRMTKKESFSCPALSGGRIHRVFLGCRKFNFMIQQRLHGNTQATE